MKDNDSKPSVPLVVAEIRRLRRTVFWLLFLNFFLVLATTAVTNAWTEYRLIKRDQAILALQAYTHTNARDHQLISNQVAALTFNLDMAETQRVAERAEAMRKIEATQRATEKPTGATTDWSALLKLFLPLIM